MKIKQNMILSIGVALIFLVMFAGTAVAPPAPPAPPLDLEKYTLGMDGVWYDADDPTGPEIPIDSIVKWKYVVTNNLPEVVIGAVPDTYAPGEMVITSLSDSNVSKIYRVENLGITAFVDGLPVDPGVDTILPGESVEYFAYGIATPGQYENTATVEAVDAVVYVPGLVNVPIYFDQDSSHYFGVPPIPSITIEKSTNDDDADVAPGPTIPVGNSVEWAYVVTNDGNLPLKEIYVNDDQLGPVGYIATLAVDQTVTFTISDVSVAGQYTNLGTVTANSYMEVVELGPSGPEFPEPFRPVIRQVDMGQVSDTDLSHYYGSVDNGGGIPEFPTIALPVVAIIGLAFIFQRRKD